jgi:hypothetical protein
MSVIIAQSTLAITISPGETFAIPAFRARIFSARVIPTENLTPSSVISIFHPKVYLKDSAVHPIINKCNIHANQKYRKLRKLKEHCVSNALSGEKMKHIRFMSGRLFCASP